ncbi:MAG: magnesium/cobalt transporter CorA [Phycisphaerales bacterium]|nr:magnesium/cobalt transporter CorA [Phycisphaerales bacterium]
MHYRHVLRRARLAKIHRRTPPGSTPGTLVPDPAAAAPVIHIIAYGPEGLHEETVPNLGALEAIRSKWPVVWVNVDGLGDARVLEECGRQFGLHRLALEDVINTYQRPKVEAYPGCLFIVTRMAREQPDPAVPLDTEQLSIFLGAGFVLTFQDKPGDSLEPVRQRIRQDSGRIRRVRADYLAYALVDASIDGYFPLLEHVGERLEELEDAVMVTSDAACVQRLHQLKRDLIGVRRAMWPLRDAMNILIREPSPLIEDDTKIFLRDCYDHTIQIIDLVEMYRELAADLMQMYLSQVNNRMNEVMKFLALISTIFIPLNFIASIYGMNFDPDTSPYNMPELRWRFGYVGALIVMSVVGALLFLYFARKGWLRSTTKIPRR